MLQYTAYIPWNLLKYRQCTTVIRLFSNPLVIIRNVQHTGIYV